MNLTDLPEDIFHIISDFLAPPDLLNFCSTTRNLYTNDAIRLSPSFWSHATRDTFRVPQHPITEHDGRRWMQLYRRMRTQTKVYTWGNNDNGCLGGQLEMFGGVQPLRGTRQIHGRIRARLSPASVSWPAETRMGDLGAVADLQSGGWSTTALNSKGQLWTVGVIDGQEYGLLPSPVPHKLAYPPGFVEPGSRPDASDAYDAYTAIRQFSSGRAHVLGLSDSGRIWSWDDTNRPGLHIKFLYIDLVESQHGLISKRIGAVEKVVAGWGRSSAYINGTGIVVWEPSNNSEIQGESDQSMGDGMMVLQSWCIPGTNYVRPSSSSHSHHTNTQGSGKQHDPTNVDIGEVTNWIVLEKYVVFTTDVGALYASLIPNSNTESAHATPSVCLNANFTTSDPSEHVLDIQGSFRSFAIFKKSGEVLLGDQNLLHFRLNPQHHRDPASYGVAVSMDPPPPTFHDIKLRRIPALQNAGVIALGFGDWHYHALHSNGTISSYGHEPKSCGALGLGGGGKQVLRGVEIRHNSADGFLTSECFTSGRRVCFEPEKSIWLEHLLRNGSHDDLVARRELMQRADVRNEVSEWFEHRLNNWETDAPIRDSDEIMLEKADERDEDGLPAYFALSVAAAGWHSGALVLVNGAKARRIRERYYARVGDAQVKEKAASSVFDMAREYVSSWTLRGADETRDTSEPRWVWQARDEAFPRLRLKSGEIMPGSTDVLELPQHLREWRNVEMVDL